MKDSINQHDEAMIKLLNQYLDDSVENLPPYAAMAARFQFSPAFERRMQPLLVKARKLDQRWWRLNQPQARLRKRLVLIAIILAILASLATVTIARQEIWEFIVTTFERFSQITFKAQRDPDPAFRLGVEHLKIPDGYRETERFETDDSVIVVCKTEDGRLISFYRALYTGSLLVDTENATVEEINIRGHVGMLISKNGISTFVWQDHLDIYILSGPLSKDDLLAILP